MLPGRLTILIADDDPEDQLLTQEAFEEHGWATDVRCVADGVELLNYLQHRGIYTAASAPRPELILLDLNMPRKDGHTALTELKADPKLRRIPVVILTTSCTEEDIVRAYDLGCNGFITKPVTFDALLTMTRTLGEYWFSLVCLPVDGRAKGSLALPR